MEQKAGALSKRGVKSIIIAVIAVIIAAASAALFYKGTNAYASGEAQTGYREYSVSKGNITVGISESGTASVGRSYVTFPVSAEIEEVYVKVGSKVSKGDKLAKLSTDDIDEVKAQYERKIADAKLELDTALGEKAAKVAEAKKVYDNSISGASSADGVYDLSITKIANDISDAEKNASNLKKQLSEYEAMLKTYPADYRKYSEYESKYKEYADTYEEYGDVYSGYEKTLKGYEKELTKLKDEYNDYLDSISDDLTKVKELKDALDKAEEALKTAEEKYKDAKNDASSENTQPRTSDTASASSQQTEAANNNSAQTNTNTAENSLKTAEKERDKAAETYRKARTEYQDYISLDKTLEMRIEERENKIEAAQKKVDDYKEMMEKYADMMSDYQKKMNKYKAEFDEYKSDFNDIYGNLDKEDIEEKIENIKSEIESAEYKLDDLNVNKTGSELSARQKKDDSVLAAQSALTVYNNTVAKIEKDISDKQDAYDELCREYDELTENMGDGIYIYADCSGQAAQVDISAGDTITANRTVITLTDSSEVYVSAAVSESDISSLTVGQATSVVFSAYENVTMSGVIDTIAVEPARSSGSVSYTVSVKVETDGKYDIREGMTAEITFLQKQVTDVLYTNVNAVTFRDGVSYVLICDESGDPAEKQVTTGFTDGRYVEISSGVSAGDKVLAEIQLSENKTNKTR